MKHLSRSYEQGMFWWLKRASDVKFTEEYGMCTEKNAVR